MYTFRTSLIGLLSIGLALAPIDASAATSPSCTLTVYTPRGEVSTRKDMSVLVKEGEKLTVSWVTKNATKVTLNRNSVVHSGSETFTVTRGATYDLGASNGSRKADCEASLDVVAGEIDTGSLTTTTAKPTITGTAKGTKAVQITIEDDNGKRVFSSKELKLKKGKWSAKLTKSLSAGTYLVTLYGSKDLELNAITTGVLTVLEKGSGSSTSGGSISLSTVPLLMGGTAIAGSSVPVAYIKVSNTGKTPAAIEGFTMVETGSAPDDVVIGFSTNDDKGGSRATVATQFKNGRANVPLVATIAPGQLRIFTIKANLSRSSGAMGSQLKINTAGVLTGASVKNVFPLPGTTFTLAF